MKKLFTAIAVVAIMALISLSASAANTWSVYPAESATTDGSLYEQEGTDADGPSPIDASGQGGNNHTNWKYQYGTYSATGIYRGGLAWEWDSITGDNDLEVECDIEMYLHEEISGHKIYFHIGNLYTATPDDKRAIVDGSFTSNNGQYIGLQFPMTDKTPDDFHLAGDANEGVIDDAMVSERDTWRTQDNSFGIKMMLREAGGIWRAADDFGEGSHSTEINTLFWLINNGDPGSYSYQWKIELLPDTDQPDGDYYLDPEIVMAPVL